jgi:thiaminase
MTSKVEKLTTHLISMFTTQPSYSGAVNHPFLLAAGQGSLAHDSLALWLSQDRIYAAHAYPQFIGRLIAQIPFSSSHGLSSPEELMNQRTLKILTFSIENVVKEVEFFKDTSKKWGLAIEGWKERKGTRDYTAEMVRVSQSLQDGLIFLWAMEKVKISLTVCVPG